MVRLSVALVALFGLAACGGGGRFTPGGPNYGAGVVLFATGPIQRACQSQGRKAATAQRCGCVQAVANQALSPADQRRGVKFFRDPHKAQEVRQSSSASNERFWRDWKAFGDRAEQLCANT